MSTERELRRQAQAERTRHQVEQLAGLRVVVGTRSGEEMQMGPVLVQDEAELIANPVLVGMAEDVRETAKPDPIAIQMRHLEEPSDLVEVASPTPQDWESAREFARFLRSKFPTGEGGTIRLTVDIADELDAFLRRGLS